MAQGRLLEFTGNEKQKEAMRRWADMTTNEIVYGGAKYGGKSFLGGNCVFGTALTYPDTHWFVARQTLSDLRKYTMPTIYEVFQKWKIEFSHYCKYNGQDNYFQCYNTSRVYLLEAAYIPRDPLFERFGSMQMTGGWIEEGGEIHPLAKANLRISIGRKNNERYGLKPKLLITCNPKKNWLYSDFYKPHSKGELPPDKAFIKALPTDNIHGDQEYIKQLSQMKDETMLRRLFYGDWEYEDDPLCLIAYDRILDLFSNVFVIPGTKYISADIARFGKDHTVIMYWEGWRLLEVIVLKKPSIPESAARIRQLAAVRGVPRSQIVVDEDGVGGGVRDLLECKGFIANSSPVEVKGEKENYANLKSQCYFKLAEKINAAEVYVETQDELIKERLTEDLEHVKQKAVDDDRKKSIISKDEVKAQLGRSPDYSDCMMMRVLFDVKPPLKAATIYTRKS